MSGAESRACILLSTYNGEAFLPAQLESLRAQTETRWILYWRDDGSTDGSVPLLQAFAAGLPEGRVVPVQGGERLGACASFLALLRAAAPTGLPLAFADQDDVWLPQKLAWALQALAEASGPALYCSRQNLVDEALHPLAESPKLRRPPSLAAALTQNIATGCTTVLNQEAASLVASSQPPPGTLHDWWSYLVVTASGGQVIFDERLTLQYRQHGGNLVGAPPSSLQRLFAALRRGPGAFMSLLRIHVEALLRQPEQLTDEARGLLETVLRALDDGPAARLHALRLPGFRRQTEAETALFRAWFLLG